MTWNLTRRLFTFVMTWTFLLLCPPLRFSCWFHRERIFVSLKNILRLHIFAQKSIKVRASAGCFVVKNKQRFSCFPGMSPLIYQSNLINQSNLMETGSEKHPRWRHLKSVTRLQFLHFLNYTSNNFGFALLLLHVPLPSPCLARQSLSSNSLRVELGSSDSLKSSLTGFSCWNICVICFNSSCYRNTCQHRMEQTCKITKNINGSLINNEPTVLTITLSTTAAAFLHMINPDLLFHSDMPSIQ